MLKVRGLKKRFGDLQVLKGIDLDVHEGDVISAGNAASSFRITACSATAPRWKTSARGWSMVMA